jgi:hypothetical protein
MIDSSIELVRLNEDLILGGSARATCCRTGDEVIVNNPLIASLIPKGTRASCVLQRGQSIVFAAECST